MKILLIGKNGQVGWELQRALSTLGEVVAVDFFDKTLCGDLTNLEGIAQTVRTVKPDVVVNAAAHTAVDKAESERELSRSAERPGRGGAGRRVSEAGGADGALLNGLCV